MKAPVEVHFEETMGLRDAIAYEFFMDNIKDLVVNTASENKIHVESLKKFAIASYAIADIFLSARNNITQNKNESSPQES